MAEPNIASSPYYDPSSCIYTSPRPPLSLPPHQTHLLSFLFSSAPLLYPHRAAIVDSSIPQSLSYYELISQIHVASRALSYLGINQHDVVLIVSPNSIHFPVLFLAVVSLGAVATSANPLNTRSDILKQASHSQAKLILTSPEYAHKLQLSSLPLVLIDSTSELSFSASRMSYLVDSCLLLSQVIQKSTQHVPPPIDIQQTDVAALMYTSGTVGTSKAALISHINLIAAAVQVKLASTDMQINGGTKASQPFTFLCCVPMFHAFGLSVVLISQLYMGNTIVLMPKYSPKDMLRAIEDYKVTHLPVVPTIMVSLRKLESFRNANLSSIAEVLCGAGCVTKETMEEIQQSLPDTILKMDYGMTEASGRIAVSSDRPLKGCIGFIGPLVSGMEALVVDVSSGEKLPPNKQGELWIRGPNIMQGYLDDEKATTLTISKDGWLHTGDLVFFDTKGNLHIVGRLKDLIKYKGFQVSPIELEMLLMTHAEIVDVAVVPFQDEYAGEVPLAFVVRASGSTLREHDVIKYIEDKVAPYKKVRKVEFVATLPRTSTGKVLRFELVKQVLKS